MGVKTTPQLSGQQFRQVNSQCLSTVDVGRVNASPQSNASQDKFIVDDMSTVDVGIGYSQDLLTVDICQDKLTVNVKICCQVMLVKTSPQSVSVKTSPQLMLVKTRDG